MTHYFATISENKRDTGDVDFEVLDYEIEIQKQVITNQNGFKMIPHNSHAVSTWDRKHVLSYLRKEYLISEHDSLYYKFNGGAIFNLGMVKQ